MKNHKPYKPRITKDHLKYYLKYIKYLFNIIDWKIKSNPRNKKIALFSAITLTIILITSVVVSVNKRSTPRFKKSSTHLYEASNNIFTVKVGNKETNQPVVEFEVNDAKISFLPSGIANEIPKPKKKGNKLVFENIYPNTDLTYETIENGLKEELVLHGIPDTNTYIFETNFQGTTPQAILKDVYSPVFVDQDNNYLFHMEKPFAYDASGNRTDDVIVQINKNSDSSYSIRLTIDESWLYNPARTYPITIDPTVVHDTSDEFSSGSFNRSKDTGSGSLPSIETVYQELPADEHTVGLWHMNEGTDDTCTGGEDICDVSGNDNDGTFVGTAAFNGSGKLGGDSTTFNGTSDYIDAGSDSSLHVSSDFTAEAWFKTTETGNNRAITSFGTDSDWLYYMDKSGADVLRCKIYQANDGSDYLVASSVTLTNDGEWHHGACVVSGTTLYTYLDGKLEGIDSTPTGTRDTSSAGSFTISRFNYTSGYYYFDGSIDEVRISNTARTPEEIKAAASRRPSSTYTSPVIDLTDDVISWNSFSWDEWGVATGDGETVYSSTGLVAQWDLNETSGTTANNDAEGSSCGGTPANCDGTLSGFDSTASQDADPDSSWTANNRRWGAGALQFDNTDSYVSVADSATIDSSTALSSCVWVKHNTTSDDDQFINKVDNINWDGFMFLRDETGQETGRTDIYKIWIGDNADADEAYIESATNSSNNNNWNFVCFTYTANDSEGLRLYINGIEDPNSPASTSGISSIDSGTNIISIGRYEPGASNYFSGVMDSLQLYSRALPHHEILSLYNSSNIELQTRVGADTSPDDGSWDDWSPSTSETQILSLDADATNWTWDNTTDSNITTDSDDTTTKIEGSGSLKIQPGTPQVDGNTVALWHLDETNGDNAGDDIFDETANNNDGEFSESTVPTITEGVSGKARYFDSTNDKISAPGGSVPTGNEVSITLWAKGDSAYIPTNTTSIIYGTDASAQRVINIHLPWSDSNIYWDAGNSDGETYDRINKLATASEFSDSWSHWAFTKNASTGDMKIYRNGILWHSGTGKTKTLSTITTFYVVNNYYGNLDEIRISNVELNAEEISEAYRMGRDHYINRTISSTDLSSKTSLPFYIAADRPGSYLSTTIGESPYANYQPDANTVGLWHMDEGTDDACNGGSNDVCDASGNGNHGDQTSTPPIVQGVLGKARKFDGTADYIDVGSGMGKPTNYTISAWIKPSDYTNGGISSISSGGADADSWGFVFRDTGDDVELWTSNGSSGQQGVVDVWSATNYPTDEWTHIAGTVDGTSIKFYRNGQLVTTLSQSVSMSGTAYKFSIGRIGEYNGYYFSGSIDEVRISNTARTATKIRKAYEIGLRTHPITIDFAASLDSGNLITGSGDTSFTVDATAFGLEDKGSALYVGDKLIVKEVIDDIEYIAQATVSAVTVSTGAVTVPSWDAGGTFPSGGYTANASIFKWQREVFDISNLTLDSHMNAITNLTLRVTNGNEGRTIWLDDLKSAGSYLSTPGGSTITSATGSRYFQYRTIISSLDESVSATISAVTLDYTSNNPPSTPSLDAPSDTATNQLLSPVLKTTATDTDSDYLRYKIELCEDVSMSVNCQTFDQTSSQTGWSGQNTEGSTAYTSGTQGTYTIQTALDANTTYYWRSYAIDPGGTNTWSSTQGSPYSFTTSTAPSAPTTPYAEGSTNPSGILDTTPEFSAIHNDTDGDSANYYQVEVDTQVGFDGTQMWDSTKQSMTSTADTVRSPDISYAGTALSLDGSTYYWRIKFWDVNGAEGTWSAVQNFIMNGSPETPSLDLPIDTATGVSLTPDLKTTTTDTDSDYLRYKIELCENLAMTTNCQTYDQTSSQTGWSGQDAETSTAYTSGTQATYTVQTPLSVSFTYYWRSYAIDPGGSNIWSATQATPYSFTNSSAPDSATTCVIRETDDDSQFTIEWIDIATDEDGYEIQRNVNSAGFTLLQDLAANSTSHVDSTISQNNTYQYRVAPYFTGPIYGTWCYTATLDISVGTFSIEGLNFSGINLN